MAFPSNPSNGQIYNEYEYHPVNAWIYRKFLGDNFQGLSLNTNNWSTFGEQYGSIVVNNGKCVITNNSGLSGDKIGIYSNIKFPVGSTIIVKSKNTSGRHASLIGFGEPVWWPYPHGTAGLDVGLTWYSRADNNTSNASCYDENGNSFSDENLTQNLSGDQVFTMERVSSSEVKIYRNGILEHTFSGVLLSDEYSVYFSADGWFNENGSGGVIIEIDWITVF